MYRIICGFYFLFCLGIATHAYSEEPFLFRIAAPYFPPYYYTNQAGEPDGYALHIYEKIIENAGLEWEGQVMPAKRAISMLDSGLSNSAILVRNPIFDKNDNIMISPKPVSQLLLSVYGKGGLHNVQVKEDLAGQKVVVMRGYGYGGFRSWLDKPKNKVELHEVDTFSSAIRMMEIGRVNYALLYDVNFDAGEKMLKRSAIGLKKVTISQVPLYFIINVSSVLNPKAMMKKLMDSYEHLLSRGELKESP